MKSLRLFLSATFVALLAGCPTTSQLYKEAEGLDEYAFVLTKHYTALVKEAANLKDADALSGDLLRQVRAVEAEATPLVKKLGPLSEAYVAVKNAQTQAELQAAVNEVVRKIAELIKLLPQRDPNVKVLEQRILFEDAILGGVA